MHDEMATAKQDWPSDYGAVRQQQKRLSAEVYRLRQGLDGLRDRILPILRGDDPEVEGVPAPWSPGVCELAVEFGTQIEYLESANRALEKLIDRIDL